ncbi:hypothetical protein ACFQH9_07575 [Pseudonocardia lutea]|uniref:Uncharacterized protein n=1 Tax=Pseudonocardia lutea TaxID=2172015 RepID=A0ABW1I5B9_9PSEU
MQDPAQEDGAERAHEEGGTRTGDAGGESGRNDEQARAERVDELARQMNVANNCAPPRPGDPEY